MTVAGDDRDDVDDNIYSFDNTTNRHWMGSDDGDGIASADDNMTIDRVQWKYDCQSYTATSSQSQRLPQGVYLPSCTQLRRDTVVPSLTDWLAEPQHRGHTV